jgi:hypothetical protein
MLIALRATPAGLLFRLRQTRFYGLSHENLFSGQATIQAPKLGGLAKFASKPAKQRAFETVFQVSQLPARLPVASSVFVRCRHCLPPPSISTVLCLRRHAAVAGERATVVATPRMENRKLELASQTLDDLRAAAFRCGATPWHLRRRDVLYAAAQWHLRQRAASPADPASHGQATPPTIHRGM